MLLGWIYAVGEYLFLVLCVVWVGTVIENLIQLKKDPSSQKPRNGLRLYLLLGLLAITFLGMLCLKYVA